MKRTKISKNDTNFEKNNIMDDENQFFVSYNASLICLYGTHSLFKKTQQLSELSK